MTKMNTATAEAAQAYAKKGWLAFPLPAGEKSPPLKGVTGNVAAEDAEQAAQMAQTAWQEAAGGSNLALRMGDTIIALDVDTYDGKRGAETLAALEAQLGKLPATYMSTRRGDPLKSGQRFFRVPAGMKWEGKPGRDIEIVQMTHRYSVAYPSVVDGLQYTWFGLDGEETAEIPHVDDLPALPGTWIERLKKGARTELHGTVTAVEATAAREWLADVSRNADGAPGIDPDTAAEIFIDYDGCRYDTMNNRLFQLAAEAVEGHSGVLKSVDNLQAAYVAAVSGDRAHGEAEARREFDASLGGAVAQMRRDVDNGVRTVIKDVGAVPGLQAGLKAGRNEYSSADAPSRVADELVERHFSTAHGTPNLVHYAGQWYALTNTGWDLIETAAESAAEWIMYRAEEHLSQATDDDGKPWPTRQSNLNNVARLVMQRLQVPAGAQMPVFLSFDPARPRLKPHGVAGVPVAFNNGVVDALTGEFTEAAPGYFAPTRVDCDYDPQASAPRFEGLLEKMFGGAPKTILAAQQLLGLHLAGISGQQAIFCLTGASGSGKSQFTDVLTGIKTGGAVAGTSVAALNDTHGTAPLVGKSLVILSDMAKQIRAGAHATSILKQISGGDEILINQKNQPQYSTRINAQILMVSNDVPSFSDSSDAMDRRMRYLKATGPNMEDSAEKVEGLGARLARDEAAGIANLALAALRDMHEVDSHGGDRFRIVETEAQAEIAAESKIKSNPALYLLDALDYEFTGDTDDVVYLKEMVSTMKLEAEDHKAELAGWIPSIRKVADSLRDAPLGVRAAQPRIKGKPVRVIYGIRKRAHDDDMAPAGGEDGEVIDFAEKRFAAGVDAEVIAEALNRS